MNLKKIIIGSIIILLILIQISLCGWLIYKDLKGSTNVCVIGETCSLVQDSIYGQVFGIKLPFYAIFAFTILLIIYFVNSKLFVAATSIGIITSAYLTIVQFFILKEICSTCMIVHVIMLLIFIMSIINLILNKKVKSSGNPELKVEQAKPL